MKEEKDKKENSATEERPPMKQSRAGVKKPYESEFKRKYFDYYDDVKTSDRQDWYRSFYSWLAYVIKTKIGERNGHAMEVSVRLLRTI